MLKIKEAIVVEGRYDKIALEPLVDTAIFTTDGFGIFKNKEKLALLRRVAEQRGLIVLTDTDGAGLVIRNRLRGASSPICKRRITEQKSIAQLTQSVPRTMPKASSLSGEKRRFIKSPLPLYPRSVLRRNGQHMETVDFSAFL